MDYRILGPLEASAGGQPLRLGGARQRSVLALLLLHRNEAVTTERLIDELWLQSPPPTASKMVQNAVSRLRKEIAAGGEDPDAVLHSHARGYELRVVPGELDVDLFEALLADARAAIEGGDARRAGTILREALGLWRGPPLADLAYEPFAQTEVARLEARRLVALEERIDADLAAGRHADLVGELRALVAAHPLSERLRAALMLALYRAGRPNEALDVYRETRRELIDQLGVEPGLALRTLERQILEQDAALDAPPPLRSGRALPLSRRRGARLMLAAGAGAAIAVGAAVAALTGGGGGEGSLASAPPDSLAMIDPRAGSLVAELPVGSGPDAVALGDGAVWVADAGDRTLARVDPQSRQVLDRIGLAHIPTQLTFGRSALWVASAIGRRGVVSQVDPGARSVIADRTVRTGGGRGDDLFAPPTPSAIAAGRAGVFANDLHASVWWLPRPGARPRTLRLGASHSVDGIAAGDGAVWVASGADDRVVRLDPRTGRVVAQIPIAAVRGARVASPYGVAVGAGALWVTAALAGTVSRIDPRLNAVTATIRVGRRPTRLAIGEGAVWVVNAADGTVSRIDPRRDIVTRTIRVGPGVTGIAAGLGAVWVTVSGGAPRGRAARAPRALRALPAPACSAIAARGRADLLVGSDLPTADGDGPALYVADMRAAIRYVLAAHGFRAGRFRLGYQTCDDSRPGEGSDPDRCAANGRAFALDPSLVGVIGSYNSFCSGIELPILNAAPAGPVAMISPSNTYVGLTHSGPATAADEPDRYYPTGARSFVRLLAADDYQSAGIDLFLRRIGTTRLFLLDDGEGTGFAGAAYAREAAARAGVRIVGAATWNPAARSYVALGRRIRRAGVNAVLLSGCSCSNGLRLVRDLRRALGTRVTLTATDNFQSSNGFVDAHGAFDGIYVSQAGLPAPFLPPPARALLGRVLPGRPLADIDESVAYAAQATEDLVDAIAASDGSRPSVARALLALRLRRSVVGPQAFDSQGDPAQAPITIYRVDSTAPAARHGTVQGVVPVAVVRPGRPLVR
jgi:DNA-binding SARP family transcriptional activator/DNA-binding beta-propeller fold protein YncE/ABC-type branched-subunit amino acid transport system substrate-binding protein